MWGLFLVLLQVLFIGLKLAGYIAWSWLWVLSPIWVPIAYSAVFVAGMVALYGLMSLND